MKLINFSLPNFQYENYNTVLFSVSEEDQELAARIINEENVREEHLRGNSKHHLRHKGELAGTKTSKPSNIDSTDSSCEGENADMITDAKNLKLLCENEDLKEVPKWFSKSKDVRLQTCFPNAFDPKYLMAKRKLFKQMKLLKEEQDAARNKNTSSIIKLTPCAPPTFAKNLKFKPIKGHVMKPAEKGVPTTSVPVLYPNEISQGQENKVEKEKSVQINQSISNNTTIESSNAHKAKAKQQDDNDTSNIGNSNKNKEKESQKDLSDIREDEKPKSRRTRRKV